MFDFRVKNKDRVRKKSKPRAFGGSVPEFQPQPFKQLPDCLHPYDFFKLFMDDSFVDKIVTASQQYAVRKGQDSVVKITNDNIRLCQAIMYITGYITPSSRRMFWETREDGMNVLVRKMMSRNLFDYLIKFTYFVNTVEPDPTDKY